METGGVEVRRLRAVVQYDGTEFSGFQRQAGERTVQEVLESALGQLLGHSVTVRGSGRTDAGVHARGQVISFTTTGTVPAARLAKALSTYLPADVLLDDAEDVPLGFDPQMDAKMKTYCYRVWRLPKQDAFWARYAYWRSGDMRFDVLERETQAITGRHDFLSFRAAGSSVKTSIREVKRAVWVRKDVDGRPDALWEFWISADGFLYKMVRLLVGTLLDVARGHLPPGTVEHALADPGGVKTGTCAPGKGLCLEDVSYS